MAPSSDMDLFRHTLRQSKNIICVAGAGLSAASGIPTFRGEGGWWRSYNAMELATPDAFDANPSRVWQFYNMRREKAMSCAPNPAHMALARLFQPAQLASIAPDAKFTLITQNVDGLSLRALRDLTSDPALRAPRNLIEMHGRVLDTLCTVCCAVKENRDSPLAESLGGTERALGPGEAEPEIPLELLPRCTLCGSLLRPGVVWFGEMPYRLDEIGVLEEEADLALVVGTSSVVYPAAGIADAVASHGGKVAVFNLERTNGDSQADFLFLGGCEETLPNALFGQAEGERE